jgi:hypothetical protein
LPFVLKNIDDLKEAQIFNNIQILVFYDKSSDSSLNILKNYKGANRCPMIIYENSVPLMATRVVRIANARNGLLDMIRKGFSHYEYFAMMDSNHYSCIGKIRPNILREMLSRKDEWDSVSFDREDGYYDHWALSYDPYIYSFFHFENWQFAVKKMRKNFNQIMELYKITKPRELFQVYSAFNGFALYKTRMFLDCNYSSKIDTSLFPVGSVQKHIQTVEQNLINLFENDCEHRHFHLEAICRKNARICISFLSLFERTKTDKKSPLKITPNTSTFMFRFR